MPYVCTCLSAGTRVRKQKVALSLETTPDTSLPPHAPAQVCVRAHASAKGYSRLHRRNPIHDIYIFRRLAEWAHVDFPIMNDGF